MDKYYDATGTSKAYLVAAILDPRLNIGYFERNWPAEWRIGLQEKLETHTATFV
jgi:hypothetical protein